MPYGLNPSLQAPKYPLVAYIDLRFLLFLPRRKIGFINSTYPSSQIILLGDFNIHNSAWLQHSSDTNAAGREGTLLHKCIPTSDQARWF